TTRSPRSSSPRRSPSTSWRPATGGSSDEDVGLGGPGFGARGWRLRAGERAAFVRATERAQEIRHRGRLVLPADRHRRAADVGDHVHRTVVRAHEDQVRRPGEVPVRAALVRADPGLGGRLPAGPVEVRGQPVAAWPITSQFDIIRDYNSTTGEETNK